MHTVWLLPGRRRPVRMGFFRHPDAQNRAPDWWCEKCGMEVYGKGRLCRECAARRNENEKA